MQGDKRVEVYILDFANSFNDYRKYLPDGVGTIIYNKAYNALMKCVCDFDELIRSKNAEIEKLQKEIKDGKKGGKKK